MNEDLGPCFEADLGPWLHGPVECLTCGHRWVGVWRLGTTNLECSNCGSGNSMPEPASPKDSDE